MRRTLALLTAVAATVVVPMEVLATCQNIANLTVPVGHGRRTLRENQFDTAQSVAFAKVYTTGDGYNLGGTELNFGTNKTLGYLPSGSSFNLGFAGSIVDSKTGAPGNCQIARIAATITAMNGDSCGSVQAGPWSAHYVVNTCNFADDVFRGLVNIYHFGVGFAPSYRISLWVGDSGAWTGGSSGADFGGWSEGCFRVNTSGGASGCSEQLF